MIKKLDPEKELMKLLSNEEPKRYKLRVNSKYIRAMDVQFWNYLRKRYKDFKVVDDLPEDVYYKMEDTWIIY